MRTIIASLLSIFLCGSILMQPVSAETSKVDLAKDAQSAILIEQDTGKILYEKNANKALPPASMTKIMTLLLIMEKIDRGSIKLNEKVRASEYAASMGGSQIFLEPGEEMTVDELLRGIAIASGNDAAVVMAERVAGTEEEFVKMMNNRAKELGLRDTVFKNCTGLPVPGHVTSSHDMAVMARELLKYDQAITKYTGSYEDYLRQNTDKKFWLVNTNKLVRFYRGCDGLKTGFTTEAKYCLTATAKRNDMRVIGVVMGASTSKIRNAQMTKMLDYAFGQYAVQPILKSHAKIQKVEVNKGQLDQVNVVTEHKVSVVIKKGEALKKVKQVVKIKSDIQAPLHKGQVVGNLTIESNGKVLAKVPLIVNMEVKEASYLTLLKRTMGNLCGM